MNSCDSVYKRSWLSYKTLLLTFVALEQLNNETLPSAECFPVHILQTPEPHHRRCDSELGCTAGKAWVSLIFEEDWKTNSWRSSCNQWVSQGWSGSLELLMNQQPWGERWVWQGRAVDENVHHIKCRWFSLWLPGSSHSSRRDLIGSLWLYFSKTWWERWGRWCQLNTFFGVTKKVLEIIQRECSFAARFYLHVSIYVYKISLNFTFLCLQIWSSAI